MPTMRKITDAATIAEISRAQVVREKIKPDMTCGSNMETYSSMYHAIVKRYRKEK